MHGQQNIKYDFVCCIKYGIDQKKITEISAMKNNKIPQTFSALFT
jgi:hypothetical protein